MYDPKVFPDDWVFDLSPYINYSEDQEARMNKQLEYEWKKYDDKIIRDKTKHAGRTEARDMYNKLTNTGRPMLKTWGRVHILYRKDVDEKPSVVDEILSQLPTLPESDDPTNNGWRWQYFVDNTIPFHKDPQSMCWIGVRTLGQQDIEFAEDNPEEGTKQADGIYIGKINYKVALINSKGLHAPVSDGNPRCILRNVFNHTSYQEVKDVLKEHFKCGSG